MGKDEVEAHFRAKMVGGATTIISTRTARVSAVVVVVAIASAVWYNCMHAKSNALSGIEITNSTLSGLLTQVRSCKNDSNDAVELLECMERSTVLARLRRAEVTDYWGAPIVYRIQEVSPSEESFVLISSGPDKVMTTLDDLWVQETLLFRP